MKTIKYSKDSITIPSNKIDWNGKSRYRVKSSLLQPKNHRGIESQQNPNAYSVFNQFFQDRFEIFYLEEIHRLLIIKRDHPEEI